MLSFWAEEIRECFLKGVAFLKKYLFIWLHWALVMILRLFIAMHELL